MARNKAVKVERRNVRAVTGSKGCRYLAAQSLSLGATG